MATPAPDAVKRLVDRFDQDRKVFLSADYKEEQLRAEFLNPFFTALGRDMDNRKGLSETFKQVIHEESIKACPERSEVPNYPSVDFGALWRYISLHYEENHGHNCNPR
jgi:hypothetical protein